MRLKAGPALLALGSLLALAIALQFPMWSDGTMGSGLMPAIGAGLVLAASIATLLTGRHEGSEPQSARKVASYFAGLVALPPAIVAIGMLPALALFAVAVLTLIERMEWKRALTVAVASLAFNWLLFDRLLQVSLPRSMFW